MSPKHLDLSKVKLYLNDINVNNVINSDELIEKVKAAIKEPKEYNDIYMAIDEACKMKKKNIPRNINIKNIRNYPLDGKYIHVAIVLFRLGSPIFL